MISVSACLSFVVFVLNMWLDVELYLHLRTIHDELALSFSCCLGAVSCFPLSWCWIPVQLVNPQPPRFPLPLWLLPLTLQPPLLSPPLTAAPQVTTPPKKPSCSSLLEAMLSAIQGLMTLQLYLKSCSPQGCHVFSAVYVQ